MVDTIADNYLQTIIVDCRPFVDYNSLHIRYAINAFYSTMMRRRVFDNKVSSFELSICTSYVAMHFAYLRC